MPKKNRPAVALGLAMSFALVACGGATDAETVSESSSPATVTQTVTVPASETPSTQAQDAQTPSSPSARSETFSMPRLVGMNLQLAQDKLQSLGSFVLDQTDAAGLDRLQINDSNWRVCKQSPAPGKKVPRETLVTLASVKLAEDCP